MGGVGQESGKVLRLEPAKQRATVPRSDRTYSESERALPQPSRLEPECA
jgi:hypothetical protein